jgi:hypothetical protein
MRSMLSLPVLKFYFTGFIVAVPLIGGLVE